MKEDIMFKLHSDIPQVKREKILKSFRAAEIQYLVATDVASRGLDITGVTHIFNYDTPEQAETYVHRVGRTGRGGKTEAGRRFQSLPVERKKESQYWFTLAKGIWTV